MTSTTQAAVTKHATCPRCRSLTLGSSLCSRWICGRCGEASELPDFRGEAPVNDGSIEITAKVPNGGAVVLKANGDIVVVPGAGGQLYLGEDGAAKKVALADDVDARIAAKFGRTRDGGWHLRDLSGEARSERALALVKSMAIDATRREHWACDGASTFCMYCRTTETDLVAENFPELREAGIEPWPVASCPRCRHPVVVGAAWTCNNCGEEPELRSPGEDPPADVDEQLRAMLFEVSAMAVSLRSTIDRAPALHHRLGKALADLAQSRHHFEVICRMYTDGESGADDYAAAVLEEMNAEVSRG